MELTCRHAQRLFGLRRAKLFDLSDRNVITAISSGTNRKTYRIEPITAAVAYADIRRRGVSRPIATTIAKTLNDLPDVLLAVSRGDCYLLSIGERCRDRLVNEAEAEARDMPATVDPLTEGAMIVFDLQPIVEQLMKATAAV